MTDQEKFEQEELEKFETVPEPVRSNVKPLLALRPKCLPESPEKNVWYYYRPEGCVCTNGSPYYSTLKIGTENKLLIMFCGGGCAFNAYCAARPNKYITVEGEDTFFLSDTFVMGYFAGHGGVSNKDRAENPFKDWSVVVVAYGSGDFHCGDNDFEYDDPELGKGVCRHHGYKAYRAMVEKMKEFVQNPEKLVVTGFSAGGFATALLTDDVMMLFDKCNDVTCMPDSGILVNDEFKSAIVNQWKAPKHISEKIKSGNIALDSLIHLHNKYGDRVKIALGCSYRDALLSQCTAYFLGDGLKFGNKYGDIFQKVLTDTVITLKKEIPNVALYIFDKPFSEHPQYNLTEHTFVSSDFVFDYEQDGVKPIEWAYNAVEGKSMQVGLHLLGF